MRFIVVKKGISSDLLNGFVSNLFNKINPSLKAKYVLDKRFGMDKFRSELEYPKMNFNQYDFDGSLEESFLPDIIALKKDYGINLFVVILPTFEKISDARKMYFKKLKNYLELNGVKYISFWDNKDLNNAALFNDQTHLKADTKINEMLAKELIDKGIASGQ